MVRALASAGLKKVRLTGGEPLVGTNMPELAARLTTIADIREVTLTTNGILLKEVGMREAALALWFSIIATLVL